MSAIARLGAATLGHIDTFGDFCRFAGRTLLWVMGDLPRGKRLGMLLPQFYFIGTLSIPVVMITGAFVGMVLAVQSIAQFKAIGMEARMGTIVNLSVLKELGPVLAGVMLAGRVGGGLTAELGTMRVTEQLDALRAMGADPLRVLVVPRFIACVLLIPVLVLYGDAMGILGGYIISVFVYNVPGAEFWRHASESVNKFDIFYGPIKSIFFGGALSLISCYKGFRCQPGAAGVGRACTEAFVASCMVVLGLDFFLGMVLNVIEEAIYGLQSVL